MATEAGVTMRRGLVHQFGITLPTDGPDGLVSAGLGPWYRNPAHAPFTDGFVPPTHTFAAETRAMIAGLHVEMTPAPSDADDSITIWFPELGVCVNNIVWPALFNIFAIRGEEYRDPRVLLRGLDHVCSPERRAPRRRPRTAAQRSRPHRQRGDSGRDAIQFIWDQTVRGINRDLTSGELIEFVQLPACYDESYFTQQLYGLVEHHTRQVHTGLRGWFDGYEADLFPLPTAERVPADRRIRRARRGARAGRGPPSRPTTCGGRWNWRPGWFGARPAPTGAPTGVPPRTVRCWPRVAHHRPAHDLRQHPQLGAHPGA